MKIRDMRKALDSKEISAKELAQTYFERIKKYDDKVKSFITVTEERLWSRLKRLRALSIRARQRNTCGSKGQYLYRGRKDHLCVKNA